MKWQTEAMYRRFEAGRGVDQSFPGGGDVSRLGHVFAGGLGIQEGMDRRRARRLSAHAGFGFHGRLRTAKPLAHFGANLTWYPTEFSKIRLQYNHDFLEANDFFSADAKPIRFSSSSNSSSARTARTNLNDPSTQRAIHEINYL